MPIPDEIKRKIAQDYGLQVEQLRFNEEPDGQISAEPYPTEPRSALNVGLRGLGDAAAQAGITGLLMRAGIGLGGLAGATTGPGIVATTAGGAGLGLGAGIAANKYLYTPMKEAFQGYDPETAQAQALRDVQEHPVAAAAGSIAGSLITGGRPAVTPKGIMEEIKTLKSAYQGLRAPIAGLPIEVAQAKRIADANTLLSPLVGAGTAGVAAYDNPGAFNPTETGGAANLAQLLVGLASTKAPLINSLYRNRPPVTLTGEAPVPVGDQTVEVKGDPTVKTPTPPKKPTILDPLFQMRQSAPLAGAVTLGDQPINELAPQGRVTPKFKLVPEEESKATRRYNELLATRNQQSADPRRVFVGVPEGPLIPGVEGEQLNPLQVLADAAKMRAAESPEQPTTDDLIKSAFKSMQQRRANEKRNKLELQRLEAKREDVKAAVDEEQALQDAMTLQRSLESNVSGQSAKNMEDLLQAKEVMLQTARNMGMPEEEAVIFADKVLTTPRATNLTPPELRVMKALRASIGETAAADPTARANAARIAQYIFGQRLTQENVGYPVPITPSKTGEPTVPNPEYNQPPVVEKSTTESDLMEPVPVQVAPREASPLARILAGVKGTEVQIPPVSRAGPRTVGLEAIAPTPRLPRREPTQNLQFAAEPEGPVVQPQRVQTATTVPEPIQALNAQLKAVLAGTKTAMLDTHNQLADQPIPEGLAWIDVHPEGEMPARIYYNPNKVTAEQISKAADEGTLGYILGYSQPSKPDVNADNVSVRGIDTEGNVVHEELVPNDPNSIAQGMDAAKATTAATPKATIDVVPPTKAAADRTAATGGFEPASRARVIPNSVISKANKADPEVGQALVHFKGYMEYLRGSHGDKYVGELNKLSQAAVDEAAAWRNEFYTTGKQPAKPMSPEAQKAYDLTTSLFDAFRDANNAVPGARLIGRNPNYLAHMINENVLRAMNKDATKRTYNKYMKEYLDFNKNVAAARGEVFDPVDAEKWLDTYVTAATSGEGIKEFNPLHKAARQYYLPDSMRETNLQRLLERYADRTSRDIARRYVIEQNPAVAAKLHIGADRDKINPDAFRDARDFVYGDLGDVSHRPLYETITAAQSFANSLGISTKSQIYALIESIGRHAAAATTLKDHAAQITGRVQAVAQFRSMVDKVRASGRLRPQVGYTALPDEKDFRTTIGRALAKSSYIARTTTLTNALETMNRVFDYAIGETLAKWALKSGNSRFIENFGAGMSKGDNMDTMVAKMAGNYVEHIQGSYSGAGLPHIAVRAGFPSMALRLQRYGIESMNRLAADVVVPMKEGNFGPAVAYTLAAFGVVAPIKSIVSNFISQSIGTNPSLADVKELSDNDAVEVAATLAETADMAGFFGFASKGAKLFANVARGKKQPVLGDPLASALINSLGNNMVNAGMEWNDGAPLEKVVANWLRNAVVGVVQDVNILDKWMQSEEDVTMKQGMEAKRKFEAVTGIGRDRFGAIMPTVLPVPVKPVRPQLIQNGILRGEQWAIDAWKKLSQTDPKRARQIVANAKGSNILYDPDSELGPIRNDAFLQYLDTLGMRDKVLNVNSNRLQRLNLLRDTNSFQQQP